MALKMCVPSETVVPSLRINLQEIVFCEDKNLYRMITMTLFIITKKKKKEATRMFSNRAQEMFVF